MLTSGIPIGLLLTRASKLCRILAAISLLLKGASSGPPDEAGRGRTAVDGNFSLESAGCGELPSNLSREKSKDEITTRAVIKGSTVRTLAGNLAAVGTADSRGREKRTGVAAT